MEDVLDLYQTPYDPRHPVVCLDEYPLALRAAIRPDLPAAPGQLQREDYEYRRCGSCTLFACFQPQAGWRQITVRARRTAQDFAHVIQELVDVHYPEVDTIQLVLDNLNTHTPAALYQTFPPAEARRLAAKLVWHYTPVHGSWLNMIEIEWSILAQQALKQRIGSIEQARAVVTAWAAARNAAKATIDWRFTSQQARIQLDYLYPRLLDTEEANL